jgi:hypothetical protein
VFVFTFSAVVALAASLLLLTSVPLMKVERYSLAFLSRTSTRWCKSGIGITAAGLARDDNDNILLIIALIQSPYLRDTRAQRGSYQYIRLNHTIVFRGIGGSIRTTQHQQHQHEATSMIIATMICIPVSGICTES